MSSSPLTADGLAASSQIALAGMLGVHRDTVRTWRAEGAPSDLVLAHWATWFTETGRTKLGALLAAVSPATPPVKAAGAAEGQDTRPVHDLDWDVRGKRAQALLRERELAESEGRLLDRERVTAVMRALASGVVRELADRGPLPALLPHLDGLTAERRQSIRAALAAWELTARARLAALPREVAVEHLPPVTTTPDPQP